MYKIKMTVKIKRIVSDYLNATITYFI